MEVLFNTDNNIEGKERIEAYFTKKIKEDLSRFDDKVTRVEVHLSDENGDKGGANDKKCVLEVRPQGLKPVAVSSQDDTIEQAISGATKKMISSLSSLLGKLQSH
ncbi:HPF/RaiA family ribosome-associated protein [Brumimicrobium glaciale]|jgi:ribosome-associated translation inhibitor RaiA|uniref:HPF/RaiA family ribosome-associated protein n=1 Tax=Brumimicrobium glaciale TaxID=200475 RepID=A0A4Q4KHR3_9FLAO|nr:HPF/RaiA family ribosome-associated protein [Brumimicrobium glaciale]RYM32167.1 HPF/RaiA family ribosome-associated protein [Brumimicrobium glaciale]